MLVYRKTNYKVHWHEEKTLTTLLTEHFVQTCFDKLDPSVCDFFQVCQKKTRSYLIQKIWSCPKNPVTISSPNVSFSPTRPCILVTTVFIQLLVWKKTLAKIPKSTCKVILHIHDTAQITLHSMFLNKVLTWVLRMQMTLTAIYIYLVCILF